jgi:Rad3-related DNA helicase
MRPGQQGAVLLTRMRFLAGERSTALVIPTRYGKTDVMRALTMGLAADGDICLAIMASPSEDLRGQAVEADKWDDAVRRYGCEAYRVPYRAVKWQEYTYNANGEVFLSMTTQLLVENLNHFLELAESMTHRTGKPGILFIDETHNLGEGKAWAKMAEAFMAIGWHVVLLTATPGRRVDDSRIFVRSRG